MADDMTYKALVAQLDALQRREAANGENLKRHAAEIEEVARETARIAERIAAKNVDRDTVSETHELSRAVSEVSASVLGFAARMDDTTAAAKAAAEQAKATHSGIDEAVNASSVTGIHDVDREWFTQE